MSFYLGSFSGGLVGGAQSALQMYGMYQGIQERQHELDGYDQVKAAQSGDTTMAANANTAGMTPAGPTGQDMSSTATGAYSSGVAPGTSTPAYPTDPSQPNPRVKPSSPQTDTKPAGGNTQRARQIADVTKLVATPKKITDTPTVDPAANPVSSAAMDPDAAGSPRGLPTPQTTAYAQPAPTAPTAPTPSAPPGTAAAMDPDAASGSPVRRPPLIWTAGQGLHRAAPGESGIGASLANGIRPTGPYDPNAPDPNAPDPNAPPAPPTIASPARARRLADPAMHGLGTPGAPASATASASAPEPAPEEPLPRPGQQPSLGSKILGALNPMGSAQAAEAPTLPSAKTDVPDLGSSPTHTVVANSGRAPTRETPVAPQPPTSSQNASRPAAIATQQQTQQPDPQAGPAAVSVPAAASPVAPHQTSPTIQSEPTPPVVKPPLDIKPYAALRQQSPEMADKVDKIAEKIGVNPARLALHWQLESRMHDSSPDSNAGATGPMQITPATRDTVDPRHILDPRKLDDALELGALVIRDGDNTYGADTPGSILRYQGGRGTADAFGANAEQAKTHFPNGYKYLQDAYGQGTQLSQANFTAGKPLDGPALVKAGVQGGPEGMLHGLVTSGPAGMPMTDLWRKAEGTLVAMAASKGDWAGVAHARDFIFQMSHRGAMDNLIEAHRQIMAGNNLGAAQALAKAHAYVPDNTVGKFGIDANGKLWGQQFDEHDPSQPLAKPFEITPTMVQSLLNTTQDPATYLATVTAQQKATAEMRLLAAHADYYEKMPNQRREAAADRLAGQEFVAGQNAKSREQVAGIAAQSRKDAAETSAQARKDAAQAAADARVDAAGIANETRNHLAEQRQQAREGEIAKEVEGNYGPNAEPVDGVADSSQARGRMGALHADMLTANPRGAVPPPTARDAVQGLMTNRYQLKNTADQSKVAVIDPKDPDSPITYISRSMAMSFPTYRMAEQQRAQRPASPVGAGARSPYAPPTSLAGTAQSSGIPVGGASP